MKNLSWFGQKLQHLCSSSYVKLTYLSRTTWYLTACFYRFIYLHLNPFLLYLAYFTSLSFTGFWVLRGLKPRTSSFRPKDIDFFFTSVSAVTVSSMSTVEMEIFSNTQLIVMTILMFLGGEIFVSMASLHFRNSKWKKFLKIQDEAVSSNIELGMVSSNSKPPSSENILDLGILFHTQSDKSLPNNNDFLMYSSLRLLVLVILGYLIVVHVLGVAFVSLYLALVSSASHVLKNKGLKMFTFSVFTTVSTFASCGFVSTNENMIVFSKNSGLLMILIPQVLLGNTLFPSCLRFSIWVLGKMFKKEETNYLLSNTSEIGYLHLLPTQHSSFLVFTVFGFILVQWVMFCSMEWNSEQLIGLNSYQKLVGGFFESVNSRHTGETIVDISTISQAILVLFVVMMYLPPYTSFLPIKDGERDSQVLFVRRKRRGKIVENLLFSQLSYLAIFVILVCLTERGKMKEDPLNFNVLNIVVEVISAYGNVGFTTGYSCKRQVNPDGSCQDKFFGFAGKWSNEGKILLIIVMFFGRLKQFNMDGGKAWKLL
ncbi:cation transporter HKT7 [Tripterygium wilfordii]|uniref:Cation transporter HKT7 n=1 Tax=Tripterygium wilfordii TaxID=458696 RepID=A0A7J7DRB8_TRIWF|nr:sodium transporter HKT1-like [Tripterygium wilfordii]KAF5748656.1 cation transporter HKT7 [Tripterygium wilfordii]